MGGGSCVPFSWDELDLGMFVSVDEKFVNHKQKVNGDRF